MLVLSFALQQLYLQKQPLCSSSK